MFYSAFKLTKEQTYDKAIQLVMKVPHLNICELYLRKDDDANPVYTLKWWKADRDKEMTFGQSKGYHVLSTVLQHWNAPPPTPPAKFCITFVFHFSWVLRSSQEKLNTMLMQFFWRGEGGGGVGQTGCKMEDVQMANGANYRRKCF